MMFAPIWMALLIAGMVFVGLMFLTGAVLCFRAFLGRGPAMIQLLFGIPLLSFSVYVVASSMHETTPEEKARGVMRLPAGAIVLDAKPGEWAGDGVVEFKLPDTLPEKEAFEAVWLLNRAGGPRATVQDEPLPDGLRRTEHRGEDTRILVYDAVAKEYRYEALLGL